jgi:peptidoglycan/LPS O-acetylase OafA/YrhL
MNDAAIEKTAEGHGDGLIARVTAKRLDVERYLRAVGARHRRLITLTIIAAAIATLLTASAAFGGKPFADWLTATFNSSTPFWRILCGVAAVCSLTAAVATQLQTSKNYSEHISRAQKAKASLEMLEVAIALNHLNPHEATTEYLKIIETTSFIEPAAVPNWPAIPPASS